MDQLERVRGLCLELPETTERRSHGEPTWFVRQRPAFVTWAQRHTGGVPALWCAAPPGLQAALVQEQPGTCFVPPYVGGRGWIGVLLDGADGDGELVEELVEGAYRLLAPPSLVRVLAGRAG